MKKSSLKTFLRGKNPLNVKVGCLVQSDVIGKFLQDDENRQEQNFQRVPGFERPWYCDVLDDGTAITYYPGN